MNDCGNCGRTNHLGLPDFSTMPCAVCARYGEDNDPTMWEAKPQTNYDLVISKTPEELAIYLSELANGDCPIIGDCPDGMKEKTTCTPSECWADWLKAPAEEVDDG